MTIKKTIYIGPPIDRTAARNGGGENLSHRLNQIADRYGEILDRADLPTLTEAEWSLLRDAVNGSYYEPAAMIANFADGIRDAIHLDGLDQKWGVDGQRLTTALAALSFAQQVAVVESIEAWWSEQP